MSLTPADIGAIMFRVAPMRCKNMASPKQLRTSAGARTTAPRTVAVGAVCAVGAGYVERVSSEQHVDAAHRIVRARDLRPDGTIGWTGLAECEPVRDPERFLLHDGDVLLTIRTTQIRALVVQAPPAKVLASAQFAILRPDSTRVDAHYLAWALDRAHAAGRMRPLIRGSTVQYLSPTDLAGFEIPLPPLERQQLIARVAALRRRQSALLARLSELHDRVLDASIAADRQPNHHP